MPSTFTRNWAWIAPLSAMLLFGVGIVLPSHPLVALLLFVGLLGAVIAGVHHAEVVAHKVGEPFGTLVLALAITVIEASLIVSLMLAGGEASTELARNTLFATIMIICNGVVGLCLLAGATRYGEQAFGVQGAGAALSVLIALAVMTLVLPVFTTSTPGATFSVPQLLFAGLSSLVLYGMFVFVQTIKHRDYFLPPTAAGVQDDAVAPEEHAAPPSARTAWLSFALLSVCLVAVVGIAKLLAPTVEQAVIAANAPHAPRISSDSKSVRRSATMTAEVRLSGASRVHLSKNALKNSPTLPGVMVMLSPARKTSELSNHDTRTPTPRR